MTADEPDYLGPYLRAVASHGPGFPALLYGSRDMQQRRFAVFTGSIALAGRRIADLGSGHGDLLAWLDEQGLDYGSYVGVEAVAEFDTIARERAAARELPRATFMRGDFVRETALFDALVRERSIDTIVLNGSLNTLDEARALAVLERAWTALASRPAGVLGFNFLSGGDDWERPPTRLPRRDTKRWLAWALERTPQVIFYQHYLGAHDATLIMHRAG
ncbi:Methyltransferase domain protein [Enhygromyxa salina]|uniref:Methyltransferase domain protein n=1 Tax=Enhygromyxa salina TaxID=215803 RepID=A0A2S9XYH4_9BACT|nr:class I SAM-dependent methyltransferase [Enhygromyxa salina]PRP97899.1 Methyltransferase domain protein [Enhygromyxa salina]